VSHKDGKSPLQDVFDYGNKLRFASGKTEILMRDFLRSPDTIEFIEAHEAFTYLQDKSLVRSLLRGSEAPDFSSLECLTVSKKGCVGVTRADLLLTIKAAASLDKYFEVLIYTSFIDQGLLNPRDKGGHFKRLNQVIDGYMPEEREEKLGNNKELYFNAAKDIREGLGCKSLADWNVQDADSKLYEQCAKVENVIITWLENDMVESAKHLWYLIEKQCRLVQGD
jgi:hypothetical protein